MEKMDLENRMKEEIREELTNKKFNSKNKLLN